MRYLVGMTAASGTPGAGYSGRPLAAKLGIRAGERVCAVAAPARYRALLEPLPDGVAFHHELGDRETFVHAFVTLRADLAALLPAARKAIDPDGALWVSWPKRASGVPSEVTEGTVRELALPLGLVDVKVAAVDATWSGLKLVVRRELRRPR